jgi:hypothetical protein
MGCEASVPAQWRSGRPDGGKTRLHKSPAHGLIRVIRLDACHSREEKLIVASVPASHVGDGVSDHTFVDWLLAYWP